jgi:predicted nucleotidyltransferase
MNLDFSGTVPVFQKYHIRKASLFGSYARGEATMESDVDVLIDPPEKMTLFDLAGMKLDLEKTLCKSVDVVTYNGLHPLLKKYVLADQKLLYEEK